MSNMLMQVLNAGLVGAGGAGFPTHVKMKGDFQTLIINAVECEPLLQVDKHLLKAYSSELVNVLSYMISELKLNEIIIGIKKKYTEVIQLLNDQCSKHTKIVVKPLPNVYPMGDEVVLIKEITGITLKKGELPVHNNLLVLNVETVFNIYKKLFNEINVTHSYVTIVGEVGQPGTYCLPVGTSLKWLLEHVSIPRVDDYEVIVGGPMTGKIAEENEGVKKTTKAYIVLEKSHPLIESLSVTSQVQMKRIMASCSQCRACTDMCPRHLLGHQVEPHKLMNAMANGLTGQHHVLQTALGCVSCGICELYACHHDLSPRKMMIAVKAAYAKEGVRPSADDCVPPHQDRGFRRVPSERLVAHLNLSRYDKPYKFDPVPISVPKVQIALNQHIGAPAISIVTIGESVKENQLIAKVAKGQLGANIHTGISGTVTEITKTYITVERT